MPQRLSWPRVNHLDRVGVADRPELTRWKKENPGRWKRVGLFAPIALVPVVMFLLLLYFARQ